MDYASRLKDFTDAHLGFGLVLNDSNLAESCDGGVD